MAGISMPLATTTKGPHNWILKLCKHQTFLTFIKGLWDHTKEIKAFLM